MNMKKTAILRASALILCTVLTLSAFTGCTIVPKISAEDLNKTVTPKKVDAVPVTDTFSKALCTLSLDLMKDDANKDVNALISPLSIIYALSMLTNGANGETKAQLEKFLTSDVDTLNNELYSYMRSQSDLKTNPLHIANSVWFKNNGSFAANKDFLQKNADYYGAGIFASPFDDTTVSDINNWVKANTNGMIEKIINDLYPNEVMHIINAIAFESTWENKYFDTNIKDYVFNNADGSKSDVKMLCSEENLYIENENAKGFIKPYSDGKYAFSALLPNEMTNGEFIKSLDAASLYALIKNADTDKVKVKMPEFSIDFSTDVSQTMKKLGVIDAFDAAKADFSGIANDIFAAGVSHRTHIEVDRNGTKAAAVTDIPMATKSAEPVETKTVILDKPFIYMIIDLEYSCPIFIGSLDNIK